MINESVIRLYNKRLSLVTVEERPLSTLEAVSVHIFEIFSFEGVNAFIQHARRSIEAPSL